MAQAVEATVRAVKSSRGFVPRRAAITLVRTGVQVSITSPIDYILYHLWLRHCFHPCSQTSAAVRRVKELLNQNKEAVSLLS